LKELGKDGRIILICVPQKLYMAMWGVSACPQRLKIAGYYDYSFTDVCLWSQSVNKMCQRKSQSTFEKQFSSRVTVTSFFHYIVVFLL